MQKKKKKSSCELPEHGQKKMPFQNQRGLKSAVYHRKHLWNYTQHILFRTSEATIEQERK